MPTLTLNEDDLLLVKELLNQWVPNSMVMAYGSRVKGSGHEGSDLDLVVKNPLHSEIPTQELTDLKQAFSESNLPMMVDVMDWADLPVSYRAEINQINVVLQTGTVDSSLVEPE